MRQNAVRLQPLSLNPHFQAIIPQLFQYAGIFAGQTFFSARHAVLERDYFPAQTRACEGSFREILRKLMKKLRLRKAATAKLRKKRKTWISSACAEHLQPAVLQNHALCAKPAFERQISLRVRNVRMQKAVFTVRHALGKARFQKQVRLQERSPLFFTLRDSLAQCCRGGSENDEE